MQTDPMCSGSSHGSFFFLCASFYTCCEISGCPDPFSLYLCNGNGPDFLWDKEGSTSSENTADAVSDCFSVGRLLGSFSEEQKDDGSVVSADSVEYLWDPWDSPSGGRPYTDLPEKYLSCNHLFRRKEVCILWIL